MGTSGELRCPTAVHSAILDILGCLRYLHGTGRHDTGYIGELESSGDTAEARWRHPKRYQAFGIAFFFITLLMKTRDIL